MTREEMLIGWLVFARWESCQMGDSCEIPSNIGDMLVERGWYAREEDDWDGKRQLGITDAGRAVADLNAEDWGIELELEEA